MVALSLEFQDLPLPKSESPELNKLRNKYLEMIPKRTDINPKILKIILLLCAHMDRREVSPSLQKDTEMILEKCGNLVETMLDGAFMLNMMPKTKKMSIHTFEVLLEFAQLLTQGLSLHDSNVFMLPHIDESHLKLFTGKKKPKISEIKDADFKKLQEKLSPSNFADFKSVLHYLPELKVTASAFVDEEDEKEKEKIAEGDLVTVKVKIERLNLQEGEKAGLVHSSQFPRLKLEKLWILITDPESKRLFYLKPVLSQDRVVEDSDFKFPIGPGALNLKPGKQRWEVIVKSDSYYGLDFLAPLEFEVLPEKDVKKEIFVHPDDQKIEKQATWIQSVMSGLQNDESSDEEIPELAEDGLKEYEDIE
jgi:translocation protein SEC63